MLNYSCILEKHVSQESSVSSREPKVVGVVVATFLTVYYDGLDGLRFGEAREIGLKGLNFFLFCSKTKKFSEIPAHHLICFTGWIVKHPACDEMISTQNLSYRRHFDLFYSPWRLHFYETFQASVVAAKDSVRETNAQVDSRNPSFEFSTERFSLSKCWCFSKLVKGETQQPTGNFVIRNCGRGSQARWLVAFLTNIPKGSVYQLHSSSPWQRHWEIWSGALRAGTVYCM